MYPGQLHNIRRNTWNLVHVMDLSLASSLETITGQISVMIQRNIPIRFGIVPMFDEGKDDICG
jgi:UDP-glucose:glycoprotein glucosyltransferase